MHWFHTLFIEHHDFKQRFAINTIPQSLFQFVWFWIWICIIMQLNLKWN